MASYLGMMPRYYFVSSDDHQSTAIRLIYFNAFLDASVQLNLSLTVITHNNTYEYYESSKLRP